ncbi:ferredoxin [Halanaerobium saccharolyticum]|uniref:Ferredoxin n=1 Tax=Halanaerobium saccharolyticum TaxID=43595 RepID=A0A4R6LM35_9FIRM|nr:ferredoxin [Halanaerobium saccharolyticum]TDO84600.1 ferredoxin [Halanaerobium saccharolyticum]
MADLANRVDENVEGEYYVDTQCIACGVCVGEAPDNFEMEAEYAYVYKQPEDEAEREACESALEACPVDAIGNDG